MRRGVLVVAVVCGGCSSSESPPAPSSADTPSGWRPGTVLVGERAGPRDHLDLRGLIHAHSPYSHDACDGQPRDAADALNQTCFDDFRRGLCQAAHDFVMLTDHVESFARSEYPDVLLYRPDRGDELVERDGAPVASWARCAPVAVEGGPDRVLVVAGNEGGTMSVGLDRHVAPTEAERAPIYGGQTAEGIAALQGAGAVVIAQHTEDWTPDQLVDLGFDGFEMFNLHANTITGAGAAFELVGAMSTPELLPHPDLILVPILNEDTRYLATWGTVLARGHRATTTMGSDVHQNTFAQVLPDGERVDSYRRMMIGLSNHLLVRPEADGSWDDRHLEEALRAGRLYGAFEVYGYPTGFDFHAEGAAVVEMGGTVALGAGVTLVATPPRVRDLPSGRPTPLVRVELLRAVDGGWETVAEGTDAVAHAVSEPGAYRAEVRITPLHLAPDLHGFADRAEREMPWIYASAIHVTP